MKAGKLNPQDFGCLTVQDAYYCYRSAETLNSLLCRMDKEKESELYELADSLYEGYVDYNQTFFNTLSRYKHNEGKINYANIKQMAKVASAMANIRRDPDSPGMIIVGGQIIKKIIMIGQLTIKETHINIFHIE